jgi:hypothetical protein
MIFFLDLIVRYLYNQVSNLGERDHVSETQNQYLLNSRLGCRLTVVGY